MKKITDNTYHFTCQCYTPDHDFRVIFNPEDKEIYVSTQLSQNANFFKRIWYAIKYILNIKSRYGDGHWEETVLREEDFCKLFDLMLLYSHKAGINTPGAKKN